MDDHPETNLLRPVIAGLPVTPASEEVKEESTVKEINEDQNVLADNTSHDGSVIYMLFMTCIL